VRVDSDRVEEALINRYAKRNSDLDMSLNDYVKASLDNPEKTIIRWLPKPKFERDADFWKTAKHILTIHVPWSGEPESILDFFHRAAMGRKI
jgi:hypothetical protein